MDEIKKRLIHIHHCRGVGWKTLYRFLQRDSTLQSIYEMSVSDFCNIFNMKTHLAQAFYNDLHAVTKTSILNNLTEHHILPLTLLDDHYPKALRTIYDPPWVLYCKGNPLLLNSPHILAVVGSRTPSTYSFQCLEKILPPLIKKDVVIVSGLAIGVDTIAHRYSIKEKGHTIAVLGSGFFHIYPNTNKRLAEEIEREQLLITEYPPYMRAHKWHFPARNRIISGLSRAVLVVEARERSGSLITADQSLEQGRDVFAIPGSIFSENSKGTNQLIQLGAKLITSEKDILDEWNL